MYICRYMFTLHCAAYNSYINILIANKKAHLKALMIFFNR